MLTRALPWGGWEGTMCTAKGVGNPSDKPPWALVRPGWTRAWAELPGPPFCGLLHEGDTAARGSSRP